MYSALVPLMITDTVTITRRRLLAVLAGLARPSVCRPVWISRMNTYDGPISDHFDGMQFLRSRRRAAEEVFGEVLRWQFGGDRQRAELAGLGAEPPCRYAAAARHGDKVRFSFVGHASWLIQTAGLNILVDPVWSMRASPCAFAGPKRHNDPGIAFDALPKIDIVLVSHGHYDHLDVADAVAASRKIFAARDHAARQ